MALTTDERLASIDTNIALLDQRLAAHTEADESNFTRLSAQLTAIEAKVDTLRIADAARAAVDSSYKRSAIISGGSVASAIVAVVEGIKYLVNG